MRELLLLATILLSQLSPNSHFLSQVENFLLTKPTAPATNKASFAPAAIAIAPTKLKLDDYTSGAQAVYSVDLASNEVLSSKDSDQRLQIASLTKLMTTYVILREEPTLDKVYIVPALSGQSGDSLMGLIPGESLTVRDLLAGLLINSGSDAAQTLAVGNAGSVSAFVVKMNAAAVSLNFANTHFANPVGWDDTENYSSAKEMAELARILIRSKTVADVVATKTKTVYTTSGRAILLTTTNQLLYSPGYVGVKTGFTNGANECLISLYQDGKTEILTTVLGSTARFTETDRLKGWILDHFSW